MAYEIDATPFYEILHTLLRHDDDPVALAQMSQVMEWVSERVDRLARVFPGPEWELYRTIAEYNFRHQTPPSCVKLRDLVAQRGDKTKALIDMIEEYETREADLKIIAVGDLGVPLDARIGDYERNQIYNTLNQANQISIGSWTPLKPNEPKLSGPRDALNFVNEKLNSGLLMDQEAVPGGTLDRDMEGLMKEYEFTERERYANNLFVMTGLGFIDTRVGGLRRKQLNGILGFTGQRKSMVARTMAYNAARSGKYVLHIPLESSRDEERSFYSVFHSYYLTGRFKKEAIDRGLLSPKEKKDFKAIIADFKEKVAPNLAVYNVPTNTWGEVRSLIERVNRKRKVDLVVIDYITLLRTPGARDEIADKTQIIQDAKQLAMTINKGEGLSMLTPIQGNRDGFEEAGTRDGEWALNGIFKYSEIEKSLDNCFYIWFNKGTQDGSSVRMGSCKGRNTGEIAPCDVPFDPYTGLMGVDPRAPGSGVTSKDLNPVPSATEDYQEVPGDGKYI